MTHRSLRTVLTLIGALALLSACTTPDIERQKRENAAKRVKLARLLEQLDSLNDQVFRQRAELLASRKRLDRARGENRVSDADRARVERELDSSGVEVERLQEQIGIRVAEAKRLKERGGTSAAESKRKGELSTEIAQLQKQIDVLSAAMKRQAEARAALYRE